MMAPCDGSQRYSCRSARSPRVWPCFGTRSRVIPRHPDLIGFTGFALVFGVPGLAIAIWLFSEACDFIRKRRSLPRGFPLDDPEKQNPGASHHRQEGAE